ncbi:bridge-like lipid transfer protein family member 1 isoform X1 [Drosophila kikkawai]|uniref:Bridge-like lipid transfer protein family member 1 isoform X1 n=1 Tax=Drosophila kikkawai TaxID=30033 RepID=A0A6P4IRU2_DROKI|nr:transmembrane protein KIAA1109 homolog isoform X4 [Drosophila kikkawai]
MADLVDMAAVEETSDEGFPLGFPEVGTWNTTHNVAFNDMNLDARMIWLLASLLTTITWVTYITFYNSRVIGMLITKIANRWFIKGAYFKIGSVALNPLAGKIMFRDFVYITYDYTVRAQDGYFIFRWWRSYVPKDVSEDLSHSDTRLSVQLNGYELHIYNRSDLYDKLEKTFGLEPSLLIPTDVVSNEERNKLKEHHMNLENARRIQNVKNSEAMQATTWRDLIPVIKIDICSGRFVFGNRLTPTTLSISVEEAHCTYSTKPAVCQLDHFMHFVKAKVENAKVLFCPSPKYTGLIDEPPRYMGEGFVVMMSNQMDLYFYMDEPGVVPEQPVQIVLPNGDVVEPSPPVWGINARCLKGTDFSYGPWADRQRDHLYKYFYPSDWLEAEVTPTPQPGELRSYQSFDVTLCVLNEATIDILFSKEKETNAMHITVGPASYVEVTIPWVTQPDGYTSKIQGQLFHVEATTSLQYRSLAEFESLEYKVRIHYPTKWNAPQDWSISLSGCKTSAFIVYKHKCFFQDLIEDWANKARPDVLSFVPYTCNFSIRLHEFEILMLCNEYNWIDCSSANQENNHLAFCGDVFEMSFALPFDDFLPKTVTLKFWIHGEGLDLSLYVPEVSSVRPIVLAIDENARLLTREGKLIRRPELYSKKWRKICQRSAGWIDCWAVPILALSIQYVYHPVPPLGPDPQADITTPEKEEILLSPMRIPKVRKSPVSSWQQPPEQYSKFDPGTLAADHVTVELEIGSSVLMAYGNVLRNFINLKENIFGEDQNFTDMEQSNVNMKEPGATQLNPKDQLLAKEKELANKSISETQAPEEKRKPFDPRLYRPLEVMVSVIVHDIQAHVMKNCNADDPPCPVVLIERFGFEMNKRYHETTLQVLVSPSYLLASDCLQRSQREQHINQGHLMLSAVQVRGHAMFSNEGCALDEDTLEYSWLVEVQLGKLTGKLTLPQLVNVVTGLETLILLAIDPENCLKSPKTVRNCHHGVPSNLCPQTKEEKKYKCPSSEDIKYKMTRVSVDAVDVYLIESGTALHAWISPIRLANCNLHGQRVKSGISGLLPSILLRLFMLHTTNSSFNTNTTGSNRSGKLRRADQDSLKSQDAAGGSHYAAHGKAGKRSSNSFSRRDSRDEATRKLRDSFSEPHAKRTPETSDLCENWVEVGCTSLGPILLEGASALPIPDHELHLVQHNFLREHDAKFKRLWFLWSHNGSALSSGTEISRCGCIGGCVFFGSNRNGQKFFKPTAQDVHDNYNIARYFIINNNKDFGFGESILHQGQLVFHTPPYSLHCVSLYDSADFNGKGRLYRPAGDLRNGSLKKSDLCSLPDGTKFKIGASGTAGVEKPDLSNRNKSRESIGSPNTLERRNKRYPCTRQTSVEVPYARLLDSPSKKLQLQHEGSAAGGSDMGSGHRRGSDSNRLRVSPPKTSISDSRLTGDVLDDEHEMPDEMSHSAPHSHPLEFEIADIAVHAQGLGGDHLPREVQRTISLTSENPSEMFFSAEEDISNVMSQRGSMKQRNSANSGSVVLSGKKRFSSDLSIGAQNENGSHTLPTYRSDLEIHAPDGNKTLPKRPQSTTELADSRGSSSGTPSLSSNSFISAMSSQEDVALVNLHQQVNRPIIDSPLLMASYLNHLSQVKCFNWNGCSFPLGPDVFSTPLFSENEDGGLTYIGSKMLPHFDLYSCWREIKVVPRYENATGSNSSATFMGGPKSHPWDPSVLLKEEEADKTTNGFDDGEFMSLQAEGGAACTSVVARLKGQLNVFLTPLLLEGLQRMVEAAVPTIQSMHLLSVVNFIHTSCIAKVNNDNILKRDQSLSYWSQVHSNSKRSTTERHLQGPGDSFLSDVYEESISTKTQGLIVLPKVSITMLQSSIVEEIISVAALDNVQDLSCVSLLTFYMEGISTKFHLGKTTRASMHNVYIQQTVQSGSSHKKGGIMKGTRALLAHLSSQTRPDNVQGEPILIETSEKQLEELVITLDIGRAHAQLRRLKTEGQSCAQDSPIIVTAIPEHKSKVLFECLKMPESTGIESIGYIMFECGLEGVGVKIVKRSHFEKSENSKEELAEMAGAGAEGATSAGGFNLNDLVGGQSDGAAASSDGGATSKAEAAWRLITKKPPTPKTPKASEGNAGGGDNSSSAAGDRKSTPKPLDEDVEKGAGTGNNPTGGGTGNNSKDAYDKVLSNVKETDKTSSCVIELKAVWFNFAAPPCVPITRKIDLTRLDWNLLSTASPAITAWMNPSNRLAIKIVSLMKALHTRQTAVAACLMAQAMDNEKIQRNPKIKKSRYANNYTLLSKTLQEDPSCQLCYIMQKLVLDEGVERIEPIFKQHDVPHLNTLRQGIIVLSRQWKNTLYNPILFEHQYKNKLARPINVTFSFPQNEEEAENDELEGDVEMGAYSGVGENPEESENALLLGQTQHHRTHIENNQYGAGLPYGHEAGNHGTASQRSTSTSPNIHLPRRGLSKVHSKASNYSHGNSSRSSIQMLPIISGLVEKQMPEFEYGALQEGSLSSTNSVNKFWLGAENHKEDLYFWMAKQQDSKKKHFAEKEHARPAPPKMHGHYTGQSRSGIMQDSIKLLDAHLIFEPLLTCLGVMPQQMINKFSNADISSLENFGTNLSLIGTFDSIRVDIVVSEAGDKKNSAQKPAKLNKKSNGGGRASIMMDTPLFLCERVGVELEVLKMSDGMVDQARQNVIYMSRRQLKKHTSTVINFSLNVRFISQQVNMPLLRLLHQICNMYQNVKDAQNEFHEQPELSKKSQTKDECSLASEPTDILPFNSVAERFGHGENYSDERYDKFNETMPTTIARPRPGGLAPIIQLTPSPNAKNRPQSFAQKLRSTGKSVKGKLGYTNLNESSSSPLRDSPTMSIHEQNILKMSTESKASLNGACATSMSGDYQNTLTKAGMPTMAPLLETPNCWKTIYHLLELYGTMPETKTVVQRSSLNEHKSKPHHAFGNDEDDLASAPTPVPQHREMLLVDAPSQERTRLIVFGVAKIHKTRLLATLSGLKLESEITTLNSTATWRKKARPVSLECSLTGQVGRAMIVLLEGVAPSQQTVVKVTVGKSQTLYSSLSKRGKDKNSGLLSIGAINIDIPQHPVALHGMMTRSSKQLSSTLQELRVKRNSGRSTLRSHTAEEPESPFHARNSGGNSSAGGMASEMRERTVSGGAGAQQHHQPHQQAARRAAASHMAQSKAGGAQAQHQNGLLQPLVMQFNVLLQSLSINAALLPSLQAQYRMNHVSSMGVTGQRAKFVIDLPTHTLSFNTKIQNEMNLPSEACIGLPPVHVLAEYIPDHRQDHTENIEGIVLRQGGYVNASAEIGEFERCLTTDLLNHLVFVQKVFMREINEVLQKVYGGEKPVPLWTEESGDNSGAVQESSLKRILFSINISMKRIQLTATTPCSSAVRFETGTLELQLSNRVKNLGDLSNRKLFFKAHIDFNLSLGQIIRNVIFDEAEPEFQQYAFFHTTIGLRNAFQDELLNEDKELILLTLKRPLVYVQPIAVDKAILVWLNYKNAYEYWAEKRANLCHEHVQHSQYGQYSAAQHQNQNPQVFDRVAFGQIASSNLSTLFLQLTVEDMGICLPLKQVNTTFGSRSYQDFDAKGAVVITLENTIISACNSGALVSKGKFQGLCLRFADDFETNLDDWKPNSAEPIMNVCVVSEGTFEVCSRTTAAKKGENAKWLLNVKWQMEGVDIHLDVNIGKQLSSLGHTLTMLTGFEEEETQMESPDSDEGDQSCRDTFVRRRGDFDNLPAFVFDPTIDSKKRSFMMEKEMAEQLKIINDLRTLGASHNTVAHEERRLQELQAICYKYFRRDMIQKWKRPSLRRSLKNYGRSQSYIGAGSSVSGVGVPQTLDNGSYAGRRLDTIASNDEISSLQSTPASCHSRSASLKQTGGGGIVGGGINPLGRVTFTEAMRQTSLPNADTDTETADNELDWRGDITPSEIDVDGTSVEMRRKHGHGQKQAEPNIDFELDIKVLVNSGKCVLHTKETGEDRAQGYAAGSGAAGTSVPASSVKSHKRERSIGNDWGSPTPSRRQRDKSKLRYNANALLADLTIFHIPGLDVKLHYQSKTLPDQVSGDQMPPHGRRLGSKRATLCAWMTLQSIPEETIISPHILEFLEQTLEPIPARQSSSVPPTPSHNAAVNLDILPANYVTYASFPVDVIVYFHMQPSTFRFSCLPVSRVECMLQLPSLDIVFSSKRSSEEESSTTHPGSHAHPEQPLPTGGLSVTGCLADFNVFIFHPYGGKKTSKETQFSPLSDSERKDSLSINVEFVKFHITRCRKVYIEPLPSSKRSLDQSRAVIRFSTIVDIGSASFKYDMRRLTEILAFPKAWYRRRIVRRLFLGDLSVHQQQQQQQQQQQGNGAETPTGCAPATPTPSEDASRAKDKMRLDFDAQPQQQLGHFGAVRKLKNLGKSSSAESSGTPPSEKNQITAWETLVLFAVNFTKLNVQMNIGNVCGNVVWLTKDFQSDGRLSIGSTGYKNMYAGIYLGGSALDAKGGIVGGSFEVNKINKRFHIKEEAGMEPYHTMGLSFMALELRLDYMGTSVLMTRISSFSAAMKDEWRTASQAAAAPPSHGKDQARALIFIHGDLSWDQLQIMISKSTTADLLKMYFKLEEFFTQQFKSSKRVFSSLEPRLQDRSASIKRRQQLKKKPANGELVAPVPIQGLIGENTDARHHRHWQKPLAQAVGLVVPSLVTRLPRHGNVLGGTVELRGQNISLACFHGINFKSKSWALFSLRSPSINFATEARQNEDEVLVTQTLTSSLGQTTEVQQQQNHSMAIVSRITRNIIFPPQFKTLNEWFHYAFANSEIDAVDRFPILECEREIASNSIERTRASGSSSAAKAQEHNHNREVIFALPSLQLHFKTEHKQGPTTPEPSETKPEVLCSFITEFDDHIFVTVDADAFFFLHDLITSYVTEKEKVIGAQSARAASPNLSQKANLKPYLTDEILKEKKGASNTNLTAQGKQMSASKSSLDPLQGSHSSLANAASNVSGAASTTTTSPMTATTATSSSSAAAAAAAATSTSSGATGPSTGSSNDATDGKQESSPPSFDLESFVRDWRHFECQTWHLEPTVRLLSWAGKSIEPYGVDYILNKLGFSHARTTIPKWLQRGFMDPLDKVQALMMLQLLLMVRENKVERDGGGASGSGKQQNHRPSTN